MDQFAQLRAIHSHLPRLFRSLNADDLTCTLTRLIHDTRPCDQAPSDGSIAQPRDARPRLAGAPQVVTLMGLATTSVGLTNGGAGFHRLRVNVKSKTGDHEIISTFAHVI